MFHIKGCVVFQLRWMFQYIFLIYILYIYMTMFQLHTNLNIKYTVLNQEKLHKYRIWPCNPHCKSNPWLQKDSVRRKGLSLLVCSQGQISCYFKNFFNVCLSVWVSWNHLLKLGDFKKKIGTSIFKFVLNED